MLYCHAKRPRNSSAHDLTTPTKNNAVDVDGAKCLKMFYKPREYNKIGALESAPKSWERRNRLKSLQGNKTPLKRRYINAHG